MKAQFRRLYAFVRVFWWAILLVLAFVVAVIGAIFLAVANKGKKIEQGTTVLDGELVSAVTSNIQGAVTDVKVETAIIKTKSEAEREKLAEIKSDPDPKSRRGKLADYLKKNI